MVTKPSGEIMSWKNYEPSSVFAIPVKSKNMGKFWCDRGA